MAYPFCKHIDLYWNSEKCWALDTLTGRYIHKSPFLSNFFYKCFIRFTICTKTCRLNKSNLAQWIFKYIYIYLLNIFNSIHLISKHIRFLFKRYQIDDITMNVNTFFVQILIYWIHYRESLWFCMKISKLGFIYMRYRNIMIAWLMHMLKVYFKFMHVFFLYIVLHRNRKYTSYNMKPRLKKNNTLKFRRQTLHTIQRSIKMKHFVIWL